MHTIINSHHLSKTEKYDLLLQQIQSLLQEDTSVLAKLSNCISAIHFTFKFHWTGFYLVKENQLALGIFQGPVACTSIGFGKGVCGTAWKEKKTILVDDVDAFEGHIACSSLSKSEIVVPIFNTNHEVIAVLDIDSEHYATFDVTDLKYLELMQTSFALLLEKLISTI
jgi:GAF domain-containing protein